MAQPSTTPERQRIDKYNRDPKFKRELDAKFAHQHKLSEMEDSNGSHANETDIIEALNSTSTGDSFFNSLWVVPIMIVLFLGCILLTNLVLGL
ncbi:MAG: hypothetical protein QM235_08320 [Pseudomonadota bacterium]|nr:hypothetical protein [Pseudomonadota bacterium]